MLTLRDAAEYITALSLSAEGGARCCRLAQVAIAVLLLVAERNGPTMMARIGMLQALDRHSAKLTPPPRRKRAKAYRVIR